MTRDNANVHDTERRAQLVRMSLNYLIRGHDANLQASWSVCRFDQAKK